MITGTPKTLSSLIKLAIETAFRSKWTASPAEVLEYDDETKRIKARIIPVKSTPRGGTSEYPILNNVPVQWLGGGGFTVTAPLAAGDQVLLVFCRRGISYFIKDFKSTDESGGVMQIDSAVAIPCFGSLKITHSEGLSLQKEDGSVKVEVLENSVKSSTSGGTLEVLEKSVKSRTSGGTLELKASGEVAHGSGAKITAAGDFVTALGTSLDGHVHTQANDGGGDTQSPVNPVVAP